MPTLKVSTTGQITLSAELLAHLGVKPRSQVEIEKMGGRSLLVRRGKRTRSISDAFGLLEVTGSRPISIDDMNELIAKGWAGEG